MESPIKEIVIFVLSGGLTGGIIKLSKELRERVAQKKKEKLDEQQAHLSQTVEIRRIENESDDAAWRRMREMLDQLQKEIQRLRDEAETNRHTSLSGATVQNWFRQFRKHGIEIDKLETQIIRELPHSELRKQISDLKASYDELGNRMPGNNL